MLVFPNVTSEPSLVHFVHWLWGQKAHDYYMTEYADARNCAPNRTYAGTASVQATHANM